ncbi:hypothetical protein [Arsukibacterium sp.]|uniref:hypothetical protein n=1 Tax=Arsukibacterium sp. TaxID=1977258 RepID=UPI00299E9B1B|nr:hypothetical protein [Arsukibacterium sp.]MDX1677816.1 hypothetical protein [Arsukibacterium sp.]
MDKEEVTGELALDALNKKQALLEEFEKLRPSPGGSLWRGVSAVASVMLIIWLFPEVIEQPAAFLLLILVFGVSAEIYRESKKVHKRIDLLYKLFKDNV